MQIGKAMAVGLVCLSLAACEQGQEKEFVGTIAGAGLGALVGAQFGGGRGQIAAVALGTLAGVWAGSEIGKSLDKADKLYAQRTAQDALEYNKTGQTSTWRNPDSGNSGTVKPMRTYQGDSGEDCRTFETTIYVDGAQEVGTGQACRSAEGDWQIAG